VANLTKRSRTDNGYIPRTLRDQARRTQCEACGREYGDFITTPRGRITRLRQVCEHLYPRRWLLNFRLCPNVAVNLVSICHVCHPQKIKAENALFEGDAMTFVIELRRLNWPKSVLRKAAEFYELKEIVALLDLDGRLT
jgi:hypothetical protein